MTNKKNKNNKQNQSNNHESQEELHNYFNTPTSGQFKNNRMNKNDTTSNNNQM